MEEKKKNVIKIEANSIEDFEERYNQLYEDFNINILSGFDRVVSLYSFSNPTLIQEYVGYNKTIVIPTDANILSVSFKPAGKIDETNTPVYELEINCTINKHNYILKYLKITMSETLDINFIGRIGNYEKQEGAK